MANWIFLNDGFVETDNARLQVNDLSFQRGYGIFDFFRLQGDQPLFLEDHLNRFWTSAEGLHLTVPLSREELTLAIANLIKRNSFPHSGVRLSLTGGYSADGYSLGKPNLVISQQAISLPANPQRTRGIRLLSHPYQRQFPHIKTIDYLMAIWLQPQRQQHDADDSLYHQHGFVSECPRSNFFLVTADDTIVTPAEDVLLGITRKKLLDLVRKEFAAEERVVSIAEIAAAKEAFITSTTRQILPVAQVDGHRFRQTSISQKLQELFARAYEGA